MKRLLPIVLLGAAAVLPRGLVAAEIHTQPGFYSLDLGGWRHAKTPTGELFVCQVCGDADVHVQITYGPELPANAEYKTNRKFLGRLESEESQRQFAELLIRAGLPPGAELEFKIERVRKVHIGGIDEFEYLAVVATEPRATREDALVALHKNRIVKVTLNYFEDGMNDEAATRISALLKSLKFF